MAFDDDEDPERPSAGPPLPPDDRLWRHPSEVGHGMPTPAAWPAPMPPAPPRRARAAVALLGAGVVGAAAALAVMWVAGPKRVEVRPPSTVAARAVTTAVFSPAGVPSQSLAKRMAPSLVRVEAQRDGQWQSGTGVWIDTAGTVAVASTLVSGATDLMVTDVDGTRVAAKAGAYDNATGMTILRAVGETGTPVGTEQVDAAAGEPVAVIGAASLSPDGSPQQRVMTASVSATGLRATVDPLVLHDAVQLDRAVPTDALGGVVVDADGNLVGIVLAQSGQDHLAVVIPADDAIAAAMDLRDDGKVRRAWMGVRAVDLSPTAAELLRVPGGAELTTVTAGSPAAAAEMRPGDVITQVDDKTIEDASDLVVSLRAWKPGDRVDVTWHRGTTTDHAEVKLGG
ncbi:S1C family serine protease [Aquihabitans sp. McL0605]|uniref:S1C family serine protease n=1 Tax=Aquihabitans sp. McL0605 TaxID=3415671 RepID=UPI003CFA3D1E